MKLTLKRLWLINFKGIRNKQIDFRDITNIFGENASGKTSIADAWSWLLNGKDTANRKDFEIKTLDENNVVIPNIDHEVGAEIDVDGTAVILRKVLKENWVTKRGSNKVELKGNETFYYWNDVPMKQGEFQTKISVFGNENLLKLITNPLYFNSSLKWEDRRSVLIPLIPDVPDAEIAQGNEAFTKLMAEMSGKTFKEYRAQIASKKKLLKEELERIPVRIDEVDKSMPDVLNFNAISSDISAKQQELAGIDSQIEDSTKALQEKHSEITAKQNKIHQLTTEVKNIEFQTREKLKDANRAQASDMASLERDINEATRSIADNNAGIQRANASKNTQQSERDGLRERYEKVGNEVLVFNDHEFSCPTCRRAYEEADIEAKKTELTNNFNISKSKRLADISASGKNINDYLAKQDELIAGFTASNDILQAKIAELKDKLVTLKAVQAEFNNTLSEIVKVLEADIKYNNILFDIDSLQAQVKEVPAVDNTELKTRKALITGEIDQLKQQLATRDQIDRAVLRIEELEKEQSSYAQQLADLEGTEFNMEQFNKAKMTLIEDRINSKFQYVKFKLFDQQINGGEVDCCDTLINGVPFTDANNAAKINAGLDIINTLCHHHGVFAPIFIDNRESVNNLIHCQSQIINLIVSTDQQLRVA